MVRTVSTSRTHIISEPRVVSRPRLPAAARRALGASPSLSVRPLGPADLPWVQSWTTQLGLPAPRAGRARTFILLEDGQRVGYLAARASVLDSGRGRESVLWIVSAFLTPSKRGKGLLPKYGEILSSQYYPAGKLAVRIATDNARMHRFMATGRWKKLRTTRRYVEYVLELKEPYRAIRRSQ